MADAFLGEIRIFAGNFAPTGWAFCNGQLLQISQSTALFSILGTQYGGDERTSFALPNLNGRAPMHQGAGTGLSERVPGEMVGNQSVALDISGIPRHTHVPQSVANNGMSSAPQNNIWAENPALGKHGTQAPLYEPTTTISMDPSALSITGGSQPHTNMQPFLALSFIICLNGEFPSRG
jgi:microcystin-dependent protein